jgi:hypothetical protein
VLPRLPRWATPTSPAWQARRRWWAVKSALQR